MGRIAAIHDGATGDVHRLAQAIADGARTEGAEVRVRRVAELAPPLDIAANPARGGHAAEVADLPIASHDDLRWAALPADPATPHRPAPRDAPQDTAMTTPDLPARPGPRPQTTAPTREHPFPHQQLDQRAPEHLQEELFQRASRLPGVRVGRSLVSLPESRAFHLEADAAGGPPDAFQRRTEFAHIHTDNDGSLHLTLPPELYALVLERGWGEPHPISGTMMLFGPRDADELEVAWQILQASWRWAHTGHTAPEQDAG